MYESFMHSNSESFAKVGNIFGNIKNRSNITEDGFVDELESNQEFMTAALKLFSMATSDNVYLLLPDNTKIILNTNVEAYHKGTALCHFSDIYKSSPDFLMTAFFKHGQTLNFILNEVNSTSVYGPRTLKTLEAIGWPTRNQPKGIELEINATKG